MRPSAGLLAALTGALVAVLSGEAAAQPGSGPGPASPPPAPAPAAPLLTDPCVRAAGGGCAVRALDPFYRALLAVERKEKGAVARVSHYGDSLTADDHIAGRARARLQASFGDGGAGFRFFGLSARRGSSVSARGWRTVEIVHGGAKGGRFGLGGATFVAAGGGAVATFATAARGPIGATASRFELYYLEQPGGGALEIQVDGQAAATVETAGAVARSAFRRIDVADAAHRFTVRALRGRVQVFGAVLEREGPGVVWENLGLVSSSARALARVEGGHFAEQLSHRAPDLVLFFYGANEARWTGTSDEAIAAYQATLEQVLGRVRAARPGGACLVMAPLDSADLVDDKVVASPVVPKLVEAQRRAAQARGCAFWDTYAWMGGKGAMVTWRRKGLASKDLTHIPTRAADKVADALVDALLAGFREFKAR